MKNLTRAQIDVHIRQVLDVRYSDIEAEKSLCYELLAWGQEHHDAYVIAFSHTYLGDYYISAHDDTACITHLMKARDLSLDGNYNDLLVRIYSLLGFYYESIADEQSSLEYYIEGISVCREIGDTMTEGLIYNNIAYNLQRHKGYQQALQFYSKAYELLRDGDKRSPVLAVLLNNLATVSILLQQLKEGHQYILECEKVCFGNECYDIFRNQNWCQYYVAIGDEKQALHWADRILSQDTSLMEKHYAFDIYTILFDSMLQLHNATYAKEFLKLMKNYGIKSSSDNKKQYEIRRMTYCVTFENDATVIADAYKHYSIHMRALDTISNQVITDGLRDAIRFLHVTRQRELLKTEKKTLDQQVNIDELTGVYTRRYLEMLMKNKHCKKTIGFIMIDVDCLKEYNDTYGHIEGDHILQFVGALLNRYRIQGIYPCRFGGDEFVCLCRDKSDNEIIDFIESIRYELHQSNIPHQASQCYKRITLSIGFSNEHGITDMQLLLQLADTALYQAKLDGRNTFHKQVY